MNKKDEQKAISKKIEHLVKEEGKTPKEAAGAAYGMARSGRLTKGGEYVHVGKRKRG